MRRALLNLNPSLHKLNLSCMQNKLVGFAAFWSADPKQLLAGNLVIYVVMGEVRLINNKRQERVIYPILHS